MESGEIVEYIDDRKIICAVVTESGNQRLRLLTEYNREIKVAAQRLSHRSTLRLDPAAGRNLLVASLQNLSQKRRSIAAGIEVKTLWEVLNQEKAWIDLHTITGLCFPGATDDNHQSAVIRALFDSRSYFKFKPDRFLPYTEKQVAAMIAAEQEEQHRQQCIDAGVRWIQATQSGSAEVHPEYGEALIDIFTSFFLFEKESPHYTTARSIMKKANLSSPNAIFNHLVSVGVWSVDENVDLLKFDIPTFFSKPVIQLAQSIQTKTADTLLADGRVDLTHLTTITIDGQSTLDFDDALSIEPRDGHVLVGIHISDVAQCIQRGSLLDKEALRRGSSIYMPDKRISMAPPLLAENRLSLMRNRIRPTISTMVKISPSGDIISYDIFASIIRVDHQLNYFEANLSTEAGEAINALHSIAGRFREKRISQGGIQIILPEINVWLDETGIPVVNQVNRESPSRMMVAEMMILSNWLSARFLSENGMPTIFRSQPKPKDRILKNGTGTLFQHWMQRKLLRRFELSTRAKYHCGLGLDAYATTTSPIRKYFDLVTQRQLRAVLGLERAYTEKEIEDIIDQLAQPMAKVAKLQFRRNRYWLLKYLEGRIGEKEEAIVLQRRRNNYTVLLKAYMIECPLPQTGGVNLKPQDLVQVTIQHVSARKNQLSLFLG
ncbi:MAG: exoribonuclease II [Proteobacteria bacterium]|nr:MAG: exoribonuclease II [Pseudomonadota bacterium]PIE67878.1 MAG: exoribonuclease II [Deltaproteobacteria bacterium]